jgi:hypothetical protein
MYRIGLQTVHKVLIKETYIEFWTGTALIFDKYDVSSALILYIPFYVFHNFNIFKYLNIWQCTSQSDLLVLVFLCI